MILSGRARMAAVLGWPISHSRSPRLHGYWLDHHNIDGAYVPLAVEPRHLGDVVRALPLMGFRGANVTVPHKEAVAAMMDDLSPEARRIGAVNTVIIDENRRLIGHNTDGFGFIENVRVHWNVPSGPAVVLGAGGAARAIVAALLDAGAPGVRLVNRTQEKAEKLKADLGGTIDVIPWVDRSAALADAALLVNTTMLGMAGAAPLDIDLRLLPLNALVTDIVYVPLKTSLLVAAEKRGNRIVDGIGMLMYQAVPGFSEWFGVVPEVTLALREFMLEG